MVSIDISRLRGPGIAGFLIGVLMTSPACAEQNFDLLQDFDRICLNNTAAAALATARSEGFVTPPSSMTGVFPTGAADPRTKLLWKMVDGAIVGMMMSDLPMRDLENLNGETCALFVNPGRPVVPDQVEARIGVGAGEGRTNGARILTYHDGAKGRVPASRLPDKELARQMEAGKVHMVMYQATTEAADSPMTLLIRVTPHKK